MGDFWEFVEAAWEYWGSAVITLGVAGFILIINYLYKIGSGSEGLPWYWFVITFLLCSPFIGYRVWLDQKRQHEEEILNLRNQLDSRALRKEQQETLAHFITKGIQIRTRYEALKLLPGTAAKEWDTEVCTYLHLTFGYDYAVMFQRPLVPEIRNLRPPHISEENYQVYLFFNMRLAQLQKLIEELKD